MKQSFELLIKALLVLLPVGAYSQESVNLIPRAILFSDSLVTDVSMNPHGDKLLFSVSTLQGKVYWLKSISEDRLIKMGDDKEYYPPKFDANGNVLLFQKGTGVTSFTVFNDKIGLTHKKLDLQVDGGFPLAISDAIRDSVVCFFKVGKDYMLYKVNIENGKTRKIEPIRYSFYAFDGNLDPVAASKVNNEGGTSFYRKDNGKWIEYRHHLWDEGMLMGSSLNKIISVSSDGKMIYAISHFKSDKTKLIQTEVSSGKTKTIAENTTYDLTHKEKWISKEGNPLLVAHYEGNLIWEIIDQSVSSDVEFLSKEFKNYSFLSTSSDNSKWLIKNLTGGPATYWLYDKNRKETRKVLSECPEMEEFPLAQRSARIYTTRDSIEFPLQLYLPAGTQLDAFGLPTERMPTIVYVHGGPWVGFLWDSWYSNRNFQLLADRGYAVVVPDFRGSLGYGKEIVNLSEKQWGNNMHEDILDVTQWIYENGIAPKGRLGIYGWSYGGYETMFALGKNPKVFECGLSLFGPSDLNKFLSSDLGKQPLWKNAVGDRFTVDSIHLANSSPINFVSSYEKPILMSYGLKDPLVQADQMQEMATSLFNNGKKVIYFTYRNEGHDYLRPESHVSFWSIAEPFLQNYLGGKAELNGDHMVNPELEIMYNNVLTVRHSSDSILLSGTADVFEPGKISIENKHDDYISFAPDETFLTFTRFTDDYKKGTIYFSEKKNGEWMPPTIALFSGKYNDSRSFVSPNGMRIYFASNRPTTERPNKRDLDIWYVEKLKDGWSEPVNLGDKINSDISETHPTVAINGTIYFARWGRGVNDIFYSEYGSGEYSEAKLHPTINTRYSESHPFIDPQERYILYGSTRDKKGLNGDVYVAFRNNNEWTEPHKLDIVNSNLYDYSAKITPDGSRIYFSRTDFRKGGKKSDIYYLNIDDRDLSSLSTPETDFHQTATMEEQIFPFDLEDVWPIINEVYVNGMGPFSFMIDLGASGTGRIDKSLYDSLDLKVSGTKVNSDGTGSTWEQKTVFVDQLKLGSIQFDEVDLPMRDYWEGVKFGILGLDFFSDRLLTIDYPNRLVKIGGKSLDRNHEGVMPYNRAIIVEGKAGGVNTSFSIDTGSQLNFHFSKHFLEENGLNYNLTGKTTKLERSGSEGLGFEAKLKGEVTLGLVKISDPIIWISELQNPDRVNVGSAFLSNYIVSIDQTNRLVFISE